MSGMKINLDRDVVLKALLKAKSEYDLVQPDAKPRECWSEFEALAEATGVRFCGPGVLVHLKEKNG